MQRTDIEWCTHVWNPTTSCSFGCPWCYARVMAHRFKRSFPPPCHPERLDQPFRRMKPARIFVDSAGDLFDPAIPREFIQKVLLQTLFACEHSYFVLTKRAKEMQERIAWVQSQYVVPWPRPNVWAGVSVTNQPDADERIPLLVATPAAHRFVSFEPLLGPVDMSPFLNPGCYSGIDWAIIGSPTGPGSKPALMPW